MVVWERLLQYTLGPGAMIRFQKIDVLGLLAAFLLGHRYSPWRLRNEVLLSAIRAFGEAAPLFWLQLAGTVVW